MSTHITLSSSFMDWQTPEWFLEYVRAVIGNDFFDPCTTQDNPTGAAVFFFQLIEQREGQSKPWVVKCGLSEEWPLGMPGFFNPRYGAYLTGDVDSDYEHYKDGVLTGYGRGWAARIAQYFSSGGEGIALLPSRTGVQWYDDVFEASDIICQWNSPKRSRISFVDPETLEPVSGNNADSHVFYCGPNQCRFYEVFSPHGNMVPGGKAGWKPDGFERYITAGV